MPTNIKTGKSPKVTAGKIKIEFPQSFDNIPEVVISPFWADSSGGVSHIDTITSVSTSSFEVVSANGAANYFVSWVAIDTQA